MCEHAPSTITKYAATFERFKTWCQDVGVSHLPASNDHVALYMVELLLSATSTAPVDAARAAIAWAHRKVCLPSPTESVLVQQTAQGCHRLLARPANKKRPLSMDLLRQLVEKFDTPEISLMHLQMLALVTLGFRGFMRWDDMSRLCVANVEISGQHMTVMLESRKNDQFREGHLVYCKLSDVCRRHHGGL